MHHKEYMSKTPIQHFYADQSVLITGGTGFLGKLLIEKLLRCCPELISIYVIIRKKRDKSIHERIQHLLEQPIFNRLRSEFPQFLRKIIPIEGDCTQPSLGISNENKDILLKEVSIVFHVAASVRFNEKLKQAVADNVFGTKELIGICQSMTNLKALIQVSTFYAHCTRLEIDEKFYNPPITGDRILKIAEVLSGDEFEKLENILRNDYPNNYCFTKAISEQLIQQHATKLPVGIFRPSIVASTYCEPIEGWSDNFSGPNGLVASAITGLLKVLHGDKSKKVEIVPADLTINALISCAWDVALNKTEEDEPLIYNYIFSWNRTMTWAEYYDLTFKYEIPTINSFWCNSLSVVKYFWLYYIAKTVFQTVPAFLTDTVLMILGKKTWAMRMNKKLDTMVQVLAFFVLNEWKGKNERIKSLWKKISFDDQKIFPFSIENIDCHDYTKKYMIGLRVHLLKDSLDTVPAAKIRRFRFLILHNILKYTLIIFIIWAFYHLFNKFLDL